MLVAADRAGALDVPVGQGAAGGRGDRAQCGLREDIAVLQQAEEDLLGHRVVIARGGPGEQVIGQAERAQVLRDHPVVPVGQLACGDTFGVRGDLDRRAVLVGAADHQHPVARHPLVPAEHVGRQAEAGDMADVPGAVRVRPGRRGENVTGRSGHGHSLGAPWARAERISGTADLPHGGRPRPRRRPRPGAARTPGRPRRWRHCAAGRPRSAGPPPRPPRRRSG
jgi:hypothetical protein